MKLAIRNYSRFPFASIVSVSNCLCPDGKRRWVKITAEPDTFFSIPARVKYKGKSVSGYVTGREVEIEPGKWERDMEFRVVNGRKNSGVFGDKG